MTDSMAEGKAWRYDHFNKMNTIEYLNLLQYRIIKSKEERRKQRLHELKLKARNA